MKSRYCSKCLKAITACYCPSIIKNNNQTKIIILQHPTEVSHPLGTAQIAKLSYTNLELFVGENFTDHNRLNQLLDEYNCLLLMPHETASQLTDMKLGSTPDQRALIVLDGTWKKAKKILYTSTNIQHLPKVSFQDELSTKYVLRKEPKAGYISTVEAIVESLAILDNSSFTNPLKVLEVIQSFQIKKMGIDKYKEFYLNDKS